MTLLFSQQRRVELGSAVGDPLGSTTLIESLGGNSVVPFFYDSRVGITLSGSNVASWDDVRGSGAGFGPTLTPATPSTQKPAYDSGLQVINFTAASSHNLQTASLSGVTLSGGFSIILIAGSATAVSSGTFVQLTPPGQFLKIVNSSTTGCAASGEDSASTIPTSAVSAVFGTATTYRVLLCSTTGNGGTLKIEVPTAVAKTATNVGTWSNPTHLDLGRTQIGTAFVDMSLLAVIGLVGAYSTEQKNAITSYATNMRGATLK